MKFIDTSQPGDADVLTLADGPVPVCGPGELLIQVHATGVNRPDVLQRSGLYPPPADASPILGLEAAGVVVDIGADVTGWAVGDQVCALCNGGAYAEYVAVPASQCLPPPAGLSLLEAASLPETCFTVWSNVFIRAGLAAGERLLVHGGSSGIGITAIQLATARGATVYATAGTEAKCGACRSLGAAAAINYRTEDFVERVRELTGGEGVDVILDMVGGDYIQKNIRCAATEGRIVNIAFLGGAKAEVNFMPVMLKRLTLTGSTLRPQSAAYKARLARDLEANVWPLLTAHQMRPVIDRVFPLAQVAQAHRRMESSEHIGKIVLTTDACRA